MMINKREQGFRLELGRIKGDLLALLILIPLVVVIGGILINWDQLTTKTESPPPAQEEIEPAKKPVIPSPVTAAEAVELLPSPTGELSQQVELEIDNGSDPISFKVSIKNQPKLAEVMEQVRTTGGISWQAEDYGGSLGLLITEINGVKNNDQPGYFWRFYINGSLAPAGVSSTTLKEGDRVVWKFEREE